MKQAENRQFDSVAKQHLPRGWVAFCTGKVPLRPIQRIGMLLLNGVPLLLVIFLFGPLAVSTLKGTPTVVLCLLLPVILLWGMLLLAMARIVWAALTAPSQRDDEPSDFDS
ncbi:MAG TPA: hypothetical protein VGJ30_19735 [Candidatus Angelobacter sp.]